MRLRYTDSKKLDKENIKNTLIYGGYKKANPCICWFIAGNRTPDFESVDPGSIPGAPAFSLLPK